MARANRLREDCLKLMQETPRLSVFRVHWRTTHVTGSAIEAKAAFAPGNLSAHDDYDEFDGAPADGRSKRAAGAAAYRIRRRTDER
jgi:hypothetical protein